MPFCVGLKYQAVPLPPFFVVAGVVSLVHQSCLTLRVGGVLPSVDGELSCATVTHNISPNYNIMILVGTIGMMGGG